MRDYRTYEAHSDHLVFRHELIPKLLDVLLIVWLQIAHNPIRLLNQSIANIYRGVVHARV